MSSATEQDARQRFDEALDRFKVDARELSEAWENEHFHVDHYPDYLPSFDEFVADFQDVELAEPPAPERAVKALQGDGFVNVELAHMGGGVMAARHDEIGGAGSYLLVTDGEDMDAVDREGGYAVGFYADLDDDEGTMIWARDDAELVRLVNGIVETDLPIPVYLKREGERARLQRVLDAGGEAPLLIEWDGGYATLTGNRDDAIAEATRQGIPEGEYDVRLNVSPDERKPVEPADDHGIETEGARQRARREATAGKAEYPLTGEQLNEVSRVLAGLMHGTGSGEIVAEEFSVRPSTADDPFSLITHGEVVHTINSVVVDSDGQRHDTTTWVGQSGRVFDVREAQ